MSESLEPLFSSEDREIITGYRNRHLVLWNNHLHEQQDHTVYIHRGIEEPLKILRSKAAKAGFHLCVCSGHRSFQRQAKIWNDKLSGRRPVLDSCGRVVTLEGLTDWEKIELVLRWSALPGASRHHWGTDIDIFDAAAMPDGYHLKLVAEETVDDGIFAPLHYWLDGQLDALNGFYRPYVNDTGGVLPERWHLSYAPLSRVYASLQQLQVLEQCMRENDICLVETVLQNLKVIYERFVHIE